MGGIFRGIGLLVSVIVALPILAVGLLIGLVFGGAQKIDEQVEKAAGPKYAEARNRTIETAHRIFVAFVVIGLFAIAAVTCMDAAGRTDADCEYSSRGMSCSPG